jgi:hypothetical protein
LNHNHVAKLLQEDDFDGRGQEEQAPLPRPGSELDVVAGGLAARDSDLDRRYGFKAL